MLPSSVFFFILVCMKYLSLYVYTRRHAICLRVYTYNYKYKYKCFHLSFKPNTWLESVIPISLTDTFWDSVTCTLQMHERSCVFLLAVVCGHVSVFKLVVFYGSMSVYFGVLPLLNKDWINETLIVHPLLFFNRSTCVQELRLAIKYKGVNIEGSPLIFSKYFWKQQYPKFTLIKLSFCFYFG